MLTDQLGKKVRGGVGHCTIAAPARRSVLILVWTHVPAVAVVVTAVISAVVVGGSGSRRSYSYRRGSPGGSGIVARPSRDRATRVTRATVTRTTRDRVARVRTSRKVMSTPAMNAPAAMEATPSASKAAATTAPGEGVIQCRAKQHDCREKSQSIPHDIPPCDLVPMLSIERGLPAMTRRRNERANSTRATLARWKNRN